MIYQLRVYIPNRGMMDEWVKYFNETLIPIQEKFGVKVEHAWATDDNHFVWVRSFADAEDMAAKQEALYGSPDWAAVTDKAQSFHATGYIKTMEAVLKPAGKS